MSELGYLREGRINDDRPILQQRQHRVQFLDRPFRLVASTILPFSMT